MQQPELSRRLATTVFISALLTISTQAIGEEAPAGKANAKLPLSLQQLLQFNQDMAKAHAGRPRGVPSSYDWASKPKKDRWNEPPSGFTALTGWGQAFWEDGPTSGSTRLALRNHQTLVCHGTDRVWTLIQHAHVEGAEFRPDFKDNTAVKLPYFETTAEGNVVEWSANGAFHFWPAGSRGTLPAGPLCGVLVLVEARTVADPATTAGAGKILLGLGADYWLNMTAPWRNYTTNSGVGVGRLKQVTAEWTWFGFSSANDVDLSQLQEFGFNGPRK